MEQTGAAGTVCANAFHSSATSGHRESEKAVLFSVTMPRKRASTGTVPESEDVKTHCLQQRFTALNLTQPMVVFPWEQQEIMLERRTCGQVLR